MAGSRYIFIIIKSRKGLELVSSLKHKTKNKLEMFAIQHRSIWPNFILIVPGIQKNKRMCNFHDVAIPMKTLQILKSADFKKKKKCRYLENDTLFFLRIKKIINCTSRVTIWHKIILTHFIFSTFVSVS